MMLDDEGCYQALLSHDACLDGVFFVGVRTARNYCRTVRRARIPRRDSCRFYPSAAAAEQAGFRPDLRRWPGMLSFPSSLRACLTWRRIPEASRLPWRAQAAMHLWKSLEAKQ